MRILAAFTLASAALLAAPAPAHAEETWRLAPLNWTWGERSLNDVEAAGPRDIWAGGGQGKQFVVIPGDLLRPPITILNIPAKPILQHWNGTSWTNFTPPEMTGAGHITNIEAVAPDDVWAVGFIGFGSSHDSYLAHWDGSSWTRVTPPERVNANGSMVAHDGALWTGGTSGVWSFKDGQWIEHPGRYGWPRSTATGVYALSNSEVSFWNGTSWTSIPEPPGNSSRVATSSGELWSITRTSPPAVHRWTGTAWENIPVPAEYASSTSNTIYDAGTPVIRFSVNGLRHQLRWTGTDWTTFVPPAASALYPDTFTPTSDGTLYALNPPSRHTGTAWTELPLQGTYRKVTPVPNSSYAVFWGAGPYGGLAITTNAP